MFITSLLNMFWKGSHAICYKRFSPFVLILTRITQQLSTLLYSIDTWTAHDARIPGFKSLWYKAQSISWLDWSYMIMLSMPFKIFPVSNCCNCMVLSQKDRQFVTWCKSILIAFNISWNYYRIMLLPCVWTLIDQVWPKKQ